MNHFDTYLKEADALRSGEPAGINDYERASADGQPKPLIGATPDGAPYPVETLGPLRSAVEAVQGMTGAPAAIPAQSALSCASLAVQAFADVQTLHGKAPTSIFALTIARSGERKSSCDGQFVAALEDHERTRNAERAEAFQRWQNATALWQIERDKVLSQAKKSKGAKAGAQADLEALGSAPAAPPSEARTVSEPTYEGLTKLFVEGQPSLGSGCIDFRCAA